MSECTTETSETACGFVVEFTDIISKHNMNSTNTNVGGWKSSSMRTYINSTIFSSLPNDLQNIIVSTKVISGHGPTSGETNFETQDKLYLLSPKEIYGKSEYDTLDAETKQLDYYKNQGVSLTYYSPVAKNFEDTPIIWWLRSSIAQLNTGFLSVFSQGNRDYSGAQNAYGVSPAFRIG